MQQLRIAGITLTLLLFLLLIFAAGLSKVATAARGRPAPTKLQIGVKKRAEDCNDKVRYKKYSCLLHFFFFIFFVLVCFGLILLRNIVKSKKFARAHTQSNTSNCVMYAIHDLYFADPRSLPRAFTFTFSLY